MRPRSLLAVLFTAILGFGVLAAPATAVGKDYQGCNGVWVVVDFGSIGTGTKTACATDFGTGTAALKSAGFSVTINGGFIYQLNSKPAKPDVNKSYWSYWHASVKADGSYSAWTYSQLGAGDYHPTKGNAEGWHYISLSDAASGPGISPPDNPAKPSPSPSPTKTPSSPKPSATPKPSSTPKPSASASRTPSASATSATPSATASSAGPTPNVTATPSQAPTPSATPAPTESPLVSEPLTDQDGGSPVGLIIAATIVIAGGGGLGVWWYLKGRHR